MQNPHKTTETKEEEKKEKKKKNIGLPTYRTKKWLGGKSAPPPPPPRNASNASQLLNQDSQDGEDRPNAASLDRRVFHHAPKPLLENNSAKPETFDVDQIETANKISKKRRESLSQLIQYMITIARSTIS